LTLARDAFASVTPVVLCGGRSSRFGSDKLIAPLPAPPYPPGLCLIDRPIAALREVFGPRVLLVGACDARVTARGDGAIPDPYPGRGPLGGLLAALEASQGDVFVLAGDLAEITADIVRRLLAASDDPHVAAVLARGEFVEPCVGLYRTGALEFLRPHVEAAKPPPLHALVPESHRRLVPIEPRLLRNVNRPTDL
jgi:molybdopterin-guanine dinucleotide biosynthesis protein A